MNKIKLGKIAYYSDTRIDLSNLTEKNYVGTDNLLQNKKGKVDSEYLRKKGKVTEYKENDILIANIRPYLRKIWRAKGKGGSSADVLTIRVGDSEFYPNFIYYNLFQDTFFDWVMKGAKGSKMPRGDKNQIMEFQIPKFDYLTQKKIVSVLSVIDDKIELNHKINTELEQLARQIYEYWFLQFDFPDENSNPYKSSGGKMVLNKILKSEIPVGWQVRKLGEVSEIRNGGTPSTTDKSNYGGNISWATPNDLSVSGEKFFFKGQRNISEKGAKSLGGIPIPKDSILLTSRAPIGLIAINKTETYTNQGFKNIVPNSEMISVEYLFYCLSKGIKNLINLGGGTTFKEISKSVLEEYTIIVPESSQLCEFNVHVEPIFKKIQQNIKENKSLLDLRDFLLPMLMNGQINVDNIQVN
ncbi:restriction endonuclease subunit S [Lactococcus lactis]|uniref:Restriction endonuclease subunit S n=1 Tax=Lactococcus lactis TaxID=1358 RepID=A0A552Z833_9LACT|nr:restriction endonuclease subunit S [Lactococcus lactis]MCT0078331.1 restriction endonuclease subunit S [Lactococcus lactis subsp. lactis]MCT0440978.1 restriction endonuclease subunit S [Lactococcus lactis subsp. lactis]MCT1180519.1 restriction endonuclease subunit S [Lactococcus lactis]TRW75656.1 restriction endonuclease subunit S [Lactococcus lactis]